MAHLLYESVVSQLAGVRHAPPRAGQVWAARAHCPSCQADGAKPGRQPALSVAFTDSGRVLVHCFKGCDAADIFTSMSFDPLLTRRIATATDESGRREPGGWMTAAALADALCDAAIAAACGGGADEIFGVMDMRDGFKAAAREAMRGGRR